LVTGDRAVALSSARFGHEARNPAGFPTIVDELEGRGQADKFFQSQGIGGRDAVDPITETVAECFRPGDGLGQENVVGQLLRVCQLQLYRSVIRAELLWLQHEFDEVIVIWHGRLPLAYRNKLESWHVSTRGI
jgi:hypothetical protein